MKPLIVVATLATSLAIPTLAQPGGPVELHNPHRGGGMGLGGGNMPMGGGGFGGNYPGMAAGAPGNGGFVGSNLTAVAPTAPTAPPAVAMFVDGPYLYVLRGDTLFQFDKKTLKLVNSTELPKPVVAAPAPTSTPPQDDIRTHTSPPLRPGPDF